MISPFTGKQTQGQYHVYGKVLHGLVSGGSVCFLFCCHDPPSPWKPCGLPRVWADSADFFRWMRLSCSESFLQLSAPSLSWNNFPRAYPCSPLRVSFRNLRFLCGLGKREPRQFSLLLWSWAFRGPTLSRGERPFESTRWPGQTPG